MSFVSSKSLIAIGNPARGCNFFPFFLSESIFLQFSNNSILSFKDTIAFILGLIFSILS